MPGEYFNYFTEIEEYFIRKRQKNLLISPLDWSLIEVWKEIGVPLHIVLRGIDRSFESAAEKRKRAPKTLYYCHPAVMEAFEEYQESRLGREVEDSGKAADASLSLEQVESHLQRIEDCLEKEGDEIGRKTRDRIRSLSEEMERAKQWSAEDLDRELTQIEEDYLQLHLEECDAEKRKRLEKETTKELKIYRKRLSKEIYGQIHRKQLLRKVAEERGIRSFSLLQLDQEPGGEKGPGEL